MRVCSVAAAVPLLLMILDGGCSRTIVIDEGERDVVIPCNLDNFPGPLFWERSGTVYDLYSVPGVRVQGFNIILPRVERAFNGETFQCLTYNRMGEFITLQVNFDTSPQTEPRSDDCIGKKIEIDYQRLRVRSENITLAWRVSGNCRGPFDILYYNMTSNSDPCRSSPEQLTQYYKIRSNISADNISIPVPSNFSFNNSLFRVRSSNNCCIDSLFFHPVYQENSSVKRCVLPNATVTIRSPSDPSIAKVVFFNNNEQYECPFSESFNTCGGVSDTGASYVNKIVRFSGVTEYKLVYIVNSLTLSSYDDSCESIHLKYEFFVESPPVPPDINYDRNTNTVYFNSQIMIGRCNTTYEVNITDITGSVRNVSTQSSFLTSDLFPDVCAPFAISVMASNEVGNSPISNHTIRNISRGDPCSCNIKKDGINITISNTTEEVVLQCNQDTSQDYHRNVTFRSQSSNSTPPLELSCGFKESLCFLKSFISYEVTTKFGNDTECPIDTFRGSDDVCSCYRRRDGINITLSNTTEEVMLQCNQYTPRDYSREVMFLNHSTHTITKELTCGCKESLRSLQPLTYNATTRFNGGDIECPVGIFRADSPERDQQSQGTVVVAVIVGIIALSTLSAVVIVTVIIAAVVVRQQNKRTYNVNCQQHNLYSVQ